MSPLPVAPMPDVEAAMVGYLGALLDAEVGTDWPSPLKDHLPFVAPSRGGGGMVQRFAIDEPTIDFDILAPDKATAHDLAQLVRAHVFAAENTVQGGLLIYRVEDTTLAWLPWLPDDGTEPIPRYVLVMSLRVRPVS